MMAFRILMYGAGAVSALVYLANIRQVRTIAQEAEPIYEDILDATIVDPGTKLPEPKPKPTAAHAQAPKSGELFERIFQTSKGPVDFLAESVLEGETLLLRDVVVYGRGPSHLTGLTKEAFAARVQIINEARAWGFLKLKITGRRVQNSSSAKPGHMVDITIDLKS